MENLEWEFVEPPMEPDEVSRVVTAIVKIRAWASTKKAVARVELMKNRVVVVAPKGMDAESLGFSATLAGLNFDREGNELVFEI